MFDRDKYFSEEELKAKVEKFEQLLGSVKREGMDKLLAMLRKSDMYRAPASTRYHDAVKGGLLDHSLNVYEALERKCHASPFDTLEIPEESIIVTALLHDICKLYFYKETSRNVKHYEPEVVEEAKAQGIYSRTDSQGEFVWISERGYEVDDRLPYGHGEKSVMMIEQYIRLTGQERYMIRWHMGFSEPEKYWPVLSSAIEKYPGVLAIFEADMEAAHIMDVRDPK